MSRPRDDEPTSEAAKLKWHTRDVKEKERFDFYYEVLGRQILRLTPDRPTDEPISASIDAAILKDDVTISRLELSANVVRRTAADLARSNKNLYHLGLNCEGNMYKNISGSYEKTKNNTVYFADSSVESEYRIANGSPVKVICIVFPKELIVKNADLKIVAGLNSFDMGSLPLLHAMKLLERRLSSASIAEIQAIGSAVISLLTASLMEKSDADRFLESTNPQKSGIIILAKAIIYRSLRLDNLSSASVANELGISVRYLQKIFELEGVTFHNYVMGNKLIRIRRDLMDIGLRDKPIMDIASKWGISCASTFYRNYKSQFGETPYQSRLLLLDRKS